LHHRLNAPARLDCNRPNLALFCLLLVPVLLATPACKRGKTPAVQPLARADVTQIGVNTWLWQASLATVNFMPLASVDSAGGVIVTDWYQMPDRPDERVKVQVVVLDPVLRADAVQVSATRQIRQGNGWVQAPVRAGTVQKLEEIILERARNLRQAAAARP
jgi:hypothetical protein